MQTDKQSFYDLRRGGNSFDVARKKLGVLRNVARRWENEAKQHFHAKRLTKHVEKSLHDLLLKDGVSQREASRRIGCCRRTVIRFIKKVREACVKEAGQIQFDARNATCPVHGRISVVPCVACTAGAANKQSV